MGDMAADWTGVEFNGGPLDGARHERHPHEGHPAPRLLIPVSHPSYDPDVVETSGTIPAHRYELARPQTDMQQNRGRWVYEYRGVR